MVLRDERARLCRGIEGLVAGELSGSQLADLFYVNWPQCEDRGCSEIAAFVWDTVRGETTRLRRALAPSEPFHETETIQRCVLFLRTDLEYEYPPRPRQSGTLMLLSASFPPGVPLWVSFFGLYFLLALAYVGPTFTALKSLFILHAPAFVFLLWLRRRLAEWHEEELDLYRRHGDWECWPFLWREDLDEARPSPPA